MSEGYQCDRCGSTHGGSPDSTLGIADGINRSRTVNMEPRRGQRFEVTTDHWDAALDLCKSCRNDLRRWWADGGGDITDVSRTTDDLTEKVEQAKDDILEQSEGGDDDR